MFFDNPKKDMQRMITLMMEKNILIIKMVLMMMILIE
jgi:hypothetical protein